MSSKTRIIVLHMKEVVYTIAFLILAVLLGILIYFMFGPGKSQTTSAAGEGLYTPGVYRSSLTLNKNTFDVEVTVDQNNIQSIELVNLSESTTAMFPLVKPSLESLASQIVDSQSLDDLKYSTDRKYTSQLLISAIEDALKKAENHVSATRNTVTKCMESVPHNRFILQASPELPSIPLRLHHLAYAGHLLETVPHYLPSDRQEDRSV